jgi:8-oxo-dGTP diphosphatase
MNPVDVKFCLRCGTALGEAHRRGRLRPVCPACNWIFFPDPKVAAAVLVEQDGKVLLVRRVHQPQRGLWTLPAGFVDAGEDVARAAERECLEETGLVVSVTALLDVIPGQEHARGADMVIAYRAAVVSGHLQASDDADQAEFFAGDDLPPLAFEATRKLIALWVSLAAKTTQIAP